MKSLLISKSLFFPSEDFVFVLSSLVFFFLCSKYWFCISLPIYHTLIHSLNQSIQGIMIRVTKVQIDSFGATALSSSSPRFFFFVFSYILHHSFIKPTHSSSNNNKIILIYLYFFRSILFNIPRIQPVSHLQQQQPWIHHQ